MNAAEVREKRRRRGLRAGVRVRESRLTLALAALKLANCEGAIIRSRRLRGA